MNMDFINKVSTVFEFRGAKLMVNIRFSYLGFEVFVLVGLLLGAVLNLCDGVEFSFIKI